MNDLMLNSTTMTMSSLEIAEVTGKRHDHVLRDIEKMVEELGMDALGFEGVYVDSNNIHRKKYALDKRTATMFIAKKSLGHLGKVLDHWEQTEDSLKELLEALEAFDVPEECADMFVYAIREEDTGRVKLGISRDPHERVKQLQTGNSSTLRLLAYRRATNGVADERQLHHDAADYHIRGEWFYCGEEVLQ